MVDAPLTLILGHLNHVFASIFAQSGCRLYDYG
jgi:hypothetical protein